MKVFLYLLLLFLSFIFLSYFDVKSNNNKNKKALIKLLSKDFFLIFLLTPTLMRLFGYTDLIQLSTQDYSFFVVYFLTSIGISLIYLLIKNIIYKYFKLEKVELKHKKLVYTLYSFSVLFIFLGVIFITSTMWGKKVYNNAGFNQIWITISSPLVGTDLTIINGFIDDSLLISISITYLYALIFFERVNYRLLKKDKLIINEIASRVTLIVSSITILICGLTYCAIQFNARDMIISMTQTSTYIDDNYVDPATVKLSFPTKKRNLIHIYLESVENSYFSKDFGGNMDENLMPNLLELSKEGISFSNLEKGKKGGPLDAYGCNWSVASMVNQFFGIPMKAPSRQNNYGTKGGFFPGAVGIGDILNKMGYEQTMMVGADALFGGLKYMFEDHGNFKIFDHKYAQENHLLPTDDYSVKWGFEDEKLYEFAKQELTRLANTGKPFHFLMENADTHTPGFQFNGDEPSFSVLDRDFDYAKTIKFSEKHVVEFIRWIQQQPFYENTTVVIIGDHLSMDSLFFFKHDFNNYLRTTYNLILNPSDEVDIKDESKFYNRKWCNYDFMPTILASIGVHIDGDILGLGRNLFSDKETLFERDGYEKVNREYIPKSKFYLDKLVNGKHNYKGENLTNY